MIRDDLLLKLAAGTALTAPAHLVFAAGPGDDAHPAEGTHAKEEVGAIPTVKQGIATGITAVFVFCLVLAVLYAKVWPTITKGLDERADKIQGEIEAAAAARKQAAEALESYQQNLAEARAEAQKMLEDARSQQQKLAADLKAKADTELTDMRDKARHDIEMAKRAALSEIYANTADIATQLAGKILAREVSATDHQQLIDESLAELQTTSS